MREIKHGKSCRKCHLRGTRHPLHLQVAVHSIIFIYNVHRSLSLWELPKYITERFTREIQTRMSEINFPPIQLLSNEFYLSFFSASPFPSFILSHVFPVIRSIRAQFIEGEYFARKINTQITRLTTKLLYDNEYAISSLLLLRGIHTVCCLPSLTFDVRRPIKGFVF